jgi:acyl-CoA thioesterase I
MLAFKTLSKLVLTFAAALFLVACADSESTTTTTNKPKKATIILIFGDSTSQGYGIEKYGTYYENIPPGRMYADLLRDRFKNENIDVFAPITVINASLGSEFGFEAVNRLPGLLAFYNPTHVILAHGTNDARAGISNASIADTFSTMVYAVRNSGAKALLADVTLTIYGTEFANAYSQMVASTALATGATYVPILKGIFGNPLYTLDDGYGYHQNEAAQPFMMNNVWDKLIPLLE